MSFWRQRAAPFLEWRDRLLSNPDFQRWALRTPLVRLVARRRMRALFDLCSGFVYSQVLLACTRLELLNLLAQSPRSASELAAELELPQASLDRLLEAAESLQLVERRGRGCYGLGPLGAALLGNPAVTMMIEHHSAFYSDLEDPVALLRGQQASTQLGRFWGYSNNASPTALGAADTAPYSDLMAASQALIAEQVLSSYSIRKHARLLDVGGGAGAFAAAAMQNHAGLEACVFDLPSVAERARARFAKDGYGQRADAIGGDFFNDPLPTGYDLISLIRILHDHDDRDVLVLLQAIRQVMTPGGVLLIAEPMLETRGAEPVAAAYFGFYLMAMGQGRARSTKTLVDLLHSAGFTSVKKHRTTAPLLASVMTAK